MKKRINWKNIIILLLLIFFITTLIISSYKILNWFNDNKKIQKQINDYKKKTTIKEVKDNDNTTIIEQPDLPVSNPYYNYIKTNLIDVDFKNLKQINNEINGWIQVAGTNINYPFVQTKDNSFYLNHALDKNYNNAGWVFLDYRNNLNSNDKNTILYAHGRLDKIMFGTLKNILSNDWLKDSNNFIIRMSTEYENTLWQVFSVYRIPTTSDYLEINFNSDNEYKKFLDLIKNRSNYDFNTSINTTDKILTLSTCYDNNDKVVMHAKLIKKENK
ncbi:MAG TPA: class B sortase [Bacilli bacterium]|nr:class B sortase [Bacilli bacterium]